MSTAVELPDSVLVVEETGEEIVIVREPAIEILEVGAPGPAGKDAAGAGAESADYALVYQTSKL